MENENNDENDFYQTAKPKSNLCNTRTLDNHYDPRVHEKPWIASGHLKDYKYDYNDSGLGYIINKPLKMRHFKERHEQIKEVDDINKKSKGFRHFREYENVINNEIVITIEYCTNCRQHQGSTRHDEEKYAYFANTLKRDIITQYPVVKVILKPLIFDQTDESSESIYLRSRIGAFEVQLYSKNSEGEVKRQIVFSKLRTRNWPSVSKVVEDISNYLPTSDFLVRLIDPNLPQEENKYEGSNNRPTSSKKNTQPTKLKGLHVVMRPLRTNKKQPGTLTEVSTGSKMLNDTSRLQTAGGTSRPTSAVQRPQSAFSTTSMKSLASKKSPTKDQSTATISPTIAKEYVEQADNFGVVLFKQIPHNIYEIEVLETQNYQPMKKVVNIFDLVEEGRPLTEEFYLSEQTMSFCRLKVTEHRVPFTDCSVVVAKKNPEKSSKTAILREKDPKTGVFEFMIDPGQYILTINKVGYPERKEEVVVDRGVNDLNVEMTESANFSGEHRRQQDYNVQVSKADERPSSRQRPESSKGRPESSKGRPQSAAKPNQKDLDVIPQEQSPNKKGSRGYQDDRGGSQERNDTDSHTEEERGTKQKGERVKSALVKKVEFTVFDVDTEKAVAGAQVILEEIGFKGVTNEQGKCLVPVNKLNSGKLILNHDDFFGMVEEYGGEDGADLKNGSEKKFYLIPRPSDVNEVQLRFLPGSGIPCAKFSVLFDQGDAESKKDVVVHHRDGGKEIIILKNLLKKHGVFRIVAEVFDIDEFLHPESTFILSHYDDCDPLYIFPPSENMLEGSKLIWDVGFFADAAANPQFVEINGYSNSEITLYHHLKEYQLLLNYLHNSKSDLKTLLGFKDKNRIEREGDIFVSKETIYASLDKYGLEIKNVDHLLSSARSVEGLYSFRECERRFGNLRPPFNFVKDLKNRSHSNDGSSDEGEEEYLFEDDN